MRSARCRGEVILAAGAIGSPHIMMLSGIGPAARAVATRRSGHARQAGRRRQPARSLAAADDLQGFRREDPERDMTRSCSTALGMGLNYALRRRGPMTMAPSQLGAFTQSDPSQATRQYPVSRAAAVARQVRRAAASVPGLHGERCQYTARPAAARSRSSRAILRRRRPSVRIISRPPEDRRVAADPIRVTRRIVAQPALRKYSPVEYLPGSIRRTMTTRPAW